jgi:hypothetical protein
MCCRNELPVLDEQVYGAAVDGGWPQERQARLDSANPLRGRRLFQVCTHAFRSLLSERRKNASAQLGHVDSRFRKDETLYLDFPKSPIAQLLRDEG